MYDMSERCLPIAKGADTRTTMTYNVLEYRSRQNSDQMLEDQFPRRLKPDKIHQWNELRSSRFDLKHSKGIRITQNRTWRLTSFNLEKYDTQSPFPVWLAWKRCEKKCLKERG